MKLAQATIFDGMLGERELANCSSYADYLRAGTRNIWAAWKGCDLIGKVLLDTPWKITRKGGTGEPVQNAPIVALLNNPNPFETFSDLVYKWGFHMMLTGNAYWLKDMGNMAGDRPRALYALNPKKVKVALDRNNGIVGYIYTVNGGQIPYDVSEIIHFKNPHADNDYYGLGAIEGGENLFNEFLNRDKWGSKFWKNGAAPSGLLTADMQIEDEEEFKKVKSRFQKEYGGTENAGKTAWLIGKWNYQQLGLTAVDMQHLELLQFNIENIFHMLGVPLSVAGMKEAANFATARVDDLIFRRYTIKPLVKNLTDTLQSDLVLGFDANQVLSFDIAGLVDLDAVVTSYVPLFDRGVLSINELRAAIGFPKVEDDPMFDTHYINAGLVPLELSGIGQQQTDQQTRSIVDRFISQSLNPRTDNAGVEKAIAALVKTLSGNHAEAQRMLQTLEAAAAKMAERNGHAPVVNVNPQPVSLSLEVKTGERVPVKKEVSLKKHEDGTFRGTVHES